MWAVAVDFAMRIVKAYDVPVRAVFAPAEDAVEPGLQRQTII